MTVEGHVWTAPAVQEESDVSAKRSGAVMYPACFRLEDCLLRDAAAMAAGPAGANRSLGRFRNRVIAICDAFWWSERLRSCGTRSRTLKNIPGSRNFWRDDPSRSWRWRSPTKWLVWPGRCWPRAVLIGRLRWRQRRKGTGDGRMRLRRCVHELQG